jgi:hypothetical protein
MILNAGTLRGGAPTESLRVLAMFSLSPPLDPHKLFMILNEASIEILLLNHPHTFSKCPLVPHHR